MSTPTVLRTVNPAQASAAVSESVNGALGDWPLSLMLDEAWLRSRRVLVHKLEKAALWMETDAYNSFGREQRALGAKLKSELLKQILGPRDYALLNSETIFGPSNNRFRGKITLALAFGYELGSGLHAILDGPGEQTTKAGELSSVFNLGIATFDLICDHYTDLFEDFSETFNEGVLRQLGKDSEASQRLAATAEVVEAVELRVLLKIIAWFFHELHDASRNSGVQGKAVDTSTRKLSRLLLDAYRAEVLSSLKTLAPEAELMTISRNKSALPFAIIHEVALLLSAHTNSRVDRPTASLARNIANIFWLTDDLSDVVRDLQSGDLNSILIQAGFKPNHQPEPVRDYPVLSRLLEGNYFERVSNRIRENTASALNIVDSHNGNADAANRFRQAVLFYVRGWL